MSYVGVGQGYQEAAAAAARASQVATETAASSVVEASVAAAKQAVASLDPARIGYVFAPAAAAAAKRYAQSCPAPLSQSACNKLAKAVAKEVATAAETARKNGYGYALAFFTISGVTTYDQCIAARNSLDASYALVLNTLIDIYYALWPTEAVKVIRPDNRLELPAFSTGMKSVPARTVHKDLVLLLRDRIVANGGGMNANGTRPSNPSYCGPSSTSTEQVAAAQSMYDKRYLPLLVAAKLTVAELIGQSVAQRTKAAFRSGKAVKQVAPALPPAEVAAAIDAGVLPPAAASVPMEADAAAATEEQAIAEAGMLGVPWKWWLIGGVALGGAWLLFRKKD